MEGYQLPKGKLFPFLSRYSLVEPYKSNAVNQKAIHDSIRKFLAKSKDEESVYRQILNSGKFNTEEIFYDMSSLLFAGFETTSHAVSTMLYRFKKHPQIRKKLSEALDHDGILVADPNDWETLKERYEK